MRRSRPAHYLRVYCIRPLLIVLVVCVVLAEPGYFIYSAAKGFIAKEEQALCTTPHNATSDAATP